MLFFNEKAQYFQISFMQHYDLSEDTSVCYLKRKGLLHLFSITVFSKNNVITLSLRASGTGAIVSVLTQIWCFLIDSFLSSEQVLMLYVFC